MGHQEHHHQAGRRAIPIHLLVISSTRTPATDRSGPALQEALETAGHTITGREILPDDVGVIRARLEALIAGGARAVVLTGGTGISRKDGTIEAVSGLLDKTLPGFGELFRALSFQEIGSSAILSRAVAGIAGSTALFAIPGSPAACRLAAEKLIGPELPHLIHELHKETTSGPEVISLPPDESPQVEVKPPPHHPIPPEVGPSGWLLRLWQLGGRLDSGPLPELNPGVAAVPAAVNVLSTAGQQGVITLPSGRYLAFGFPDLKRHNSRVLLLGEGSPFGEILALHRWPAKVGVLRSEPDGLLGPSGRLGALSMELTGRDYPETGRVLALDGAALLVVEGGTRVFRWDGRNRKEEGLPRGVLASLLLSWSQR